MRHRALGVAVALAAGCGRHGFDPIDDANGTAGGDSNGAVDATIDTSSACINDLSDIGTASFEITFDLQTTATIKSALVHQRDPCMAATYWDIYLNEVNRVVFEITAGGSTMSSPSLVTVANGMPHSVRCTRIGTSVQIAVDGGNPNTQVGSTFNFTSLPALVVATGHPCAGFAPLATGTVTNVCVRLL